MALTRILLKKSGIQGKLPTAVNAEFGELFINYHSASPMLSFKDNAGEIVSIKPTKIIDGGAGETPPSTGNEIGDIIFDGTNLLVWDGSQWVPVGAADLGYTAKVDGGTITNTAGTEAEIPLVGTDAGLMAPDDKTKLDGVTAGAEPNVKPDWNAAGGSDAEILNKPDIPENTSDLVNDGDGTSNFVTFDDISGLGGGSVTSVDSGDGLTGGPITGSGTLSVQADGDTIAVSAAGIKVADGKFAAPGDLPTKTSELTNDGENGSDPFITANDLPAVPEPGEVPSGGTADRPANPGVGDLFFDTDLNLLLYWDGSDWAEVGSGGDFLPLEGGNMTGAVTQTERIVTSAADGFDLSTSNFWACSLADVPAPTNGVNGQSGLIKFENVVNSWDAAFKNTPTSVEPGDIIPFYVEGPASIALGTKNVTGSVAGFWDRDGATSTLSPTNAGDSAEFSGTVTTASGDLGAGGKNITLDPVGRIEARRNSASGSDNVITLFGGIGGATNVFRTSGAGTTWTVGGTVSNISSERRLKQEIKSLDPSTCWETVKTLPFYEYEFRELPGTKYFGAMADEVPAEMVVETDQSDNEGVIRTYDNGMLQARLYVALQTALTRIEQLEARVAELEGN